MLLVAYLRWLSRVFTSITAISLQTNEASPVTGAPQPMTLLYVTIFFIVLYRKLGNNPAY